MKGQSHLAPPYDRPTHRWVASFRDRADAWAYFHGTPPGSRLEEWEEQDGRTEVLVPIDVGDVKRGSPVDRRRKCTCGLW